MVATKIAITKLSTQTYRLIAFAISGDKTDCLAREPCWWAFPTSINKPKARFVSIDAPPIILKSNCKMIATHLTAII